jgi:ABC-type transport system involved in multi-copper enzyme maturation permease subunit
MYRTLVIVRHTFKEAVVQPIFTLLMGIGAAILLIYGLLPFFTLGEDTVMYKSVGLDVILLLVLIVTLFATSKSIHEEIEDRTMLTLMSKPIYKWEVLVGKYLGIILSALLAVAILGTVMVALTWYRIPNDYQLRWASLDDRDLKEIFDFRMMHTVGIVASLFLVWLQICVLAAIGVALSTRFSLVVNLPTVILIYIAGNLTRFLFPLDQRSEAVKLFAYAASSLLPFLQTFDIRQFTVFQPVSVPGTVFFHTRGAISIGAILGYISIASAYAIAYAGFALSAGMWLFQTRELGGAEG